MKRFIAFFIAIVIICNMFTACSYTISSKEENQEGEGNYHLFVTMKDQEYLDFLETLDETKYEIVDISLHNDYWHVTYKDIEE